MDSHGLLFNAVIYLLAAVIAVPISKRLGLGSVLGYLAAGAVIGPWGLALIGNVEDILHFSEFGVVMLLFLIGLELDPKKLWNLRKPILGTGGMQVLVTTLVIAGVGFFMNGDWQASIIIGMGLALSSTAMALQSLNEKDLLPTPAGRTGFSVLLFQDIAVIPMIAFIPLLGIPQTEEEAVNPWWAALQIVLLIAGIIVVGRFVLRHVLRFVAATRLREIFTALSLLLVLGIAALMDMFGLSMALGAFLAGVLLADSEYRHALESDIEPFKGLLLGLFFISVGMSVDFGLLFEHTLLILGLTVGLVVAKIVILYVIALVTGLPKSQRALFAFVLSQGGEFAFVLFGFAVAVAALPQDWVDKLILVVALSMVTTPILLKLNEKLIEPLFVNIDEGPMDDIDDDDNPVIILGFGRFGQLVGRILHANGIGTTIIDNNPDHIERTRRFGYKTYYGDVQRMDLLHAAGAHKAKVIVLTSDGAEQISAAAKLMHEEFPQAKIFARAYDRAHAMELLEIGVNYFTREMFFSALEMGRQALAELGFSPDQARQAMEDFKQHDLDMLQQQYTVRHDEEKVISVAKQAREQLAQILESEETDLPDNASDKSNNT